MLVGIFVLQGAYARSSGTYSLNVFDLSRMVLPASVQTWLFLAFGLAFAIKVPLFPFHTWLPDAHVEAPTGASVLLAAVFLKMGAYGFIRIGFPLFPDAVARFAPVISVLAVVGIIYGGFMALVQKDIKSLVAYSSVSHMGLILLAVAAWNTVSLQGAILQMLNHGLSTGMLFFAVGALYERTRSRMTSDFGGVGRKMPVFAALFLVAVLSSLGLPGLNGFVGEILCFAGIFAARKIWADFRGDDHDPGRGLPAGDVPEGLPRPGDHDRVAALRDLRRPGARDLRSGRVLDVLDRVFSRDVPPKNRGDGDPLRRPRPVPLAPRMSGRTGPGLSRRSRQGRTIGRERDDRYRRPRPASVSRHRGDSRSPPRDASERGSEFRPGRRLDRGDRRGRFPSEGSCGAAPPGRSADNCSGMRPALFLTFLFLMAAGLTVLLGLRFVIHHGMPRGEFYGLLLLAAAGLVIMTATLNLLVVFLGFEVFSVSAYALTGLNAAGRPFGGGRSQVFSDRFVRLGLRCLRPGPYFRRHGDARLSRVGFGPARNGRDADLVLRRARPRHLRLGFQDRPCPVPHVPAGRLRRFADSGLGLFRRRAESGRIRRSPSAPDSQARTGDRRRSRPRLFAAVAAATMILGNFAALRQRNLKRILAYSGIAHAGYMLVAVVADSAGLLFYLIHYLFPGIGAFAAVIALGGPERETLDLDDFAGLGPALSVDRRNLRRDTRFDRRFPSDERVPGEILRLQLGRQRGASRLGRRRRRDQPGFGRLLLPDRPGHVHEGTGTGVEVDADNSAVYLVLFLCLYAVLQLGLFPGNIVTLIRRAVAGF